MGFIHLSVEVISQFNLIMSPVSVPTMLLAEGSYIDNERTRDSYRTKTQAIGSRTSHVHDNPDVTIPVGIC